MASDGVWERCNGEDILRWIRNYSAERIADSERKSCRRRGLSQDSTCNDESTSETVPGRMENNAIVCQKRERQPSPVSRLLGKKRKVVPRQGLAAGRRRSGLESVSTVADVIVRRVLNKVRKARNMTSLQALMTLPKGRARRSKHDDITAMVVALPAFVSPPSPATCSVQDDGCQ